ncbi:MAG: serine--tRNA ligase [Kiritimatiellia bacterium]|jgi:seryl-tRNA synthetase
MLDLKQIRDNTAAVEAALKKRGATDFLAPLRGLDEARRRLITETDELKRQRNAASEEIGRLKKAGQDTSAGQAEVKALGRQIAENDSELRRLETDLRAALLAIPNLPHANVPLGSDASGNVEVRRWGAQRVFDFTPQSHLVLGESLGILDFARATRLSGTGFPLLVGAGARLERALVRFMLDMHTREHDYLEVAPPYLCNAAAMTGTGQLPKMAEDMYHLPVDGLYLAPTAEVPVTNIYREEILERDLPIRLVAYSPCFRREAGAAGRETRGLIRVHQFDKVEMVKFTAPDQSYAELETLTANAEDVLQRLELPYRVIELCAGDLSFAAAKCYDIELWAPGQNAWLEVSSCSNFEAFQARRANIRYRNVAGKLEFVHTLNGSGVALPRLMVALLENGQQADGTVTLPVALAPYMDGETILRPAEKQQRL